MRKIKFFSANTHKHLENAVNEWLAANEKAFINEFSMHFQHLASTSEYICCILYYVKNPT